MTKRPGPNKPLIFLTGPPATRGFGINTHIRMLMGSALANTYDLRHVELGGETWSASPIVRTRRTMAQLGRFRSEVRTTHPSIAHINSAPDAKAFLRDSAALWLIAGSGLKTVFEFHGGFEQNTLLQGSELIRDFAKRTLKKASVVLTLNEYHSDMLLELCPGLENVRVIPNFLEPAMMSGLIDRPTETGDRLRLLFISRVAREKGVFDSIEAVQILRNRGVDVDLKIAGTGDDLDEAKKLAAAHDLEGFVEFAGFVAGEDKIAAYRSSDILLFPTYWNEGFPYVLLEAMAAGMPIISTTHGVMPHLLKHGTNGLLVEPRDPAALAEKIEELARKPELMLEMSESNRRTVRESYSIEEAAKAYGDLYAELLENKKGWLQPSALK
jgi:glycosyltransferase involved in cell wall biosynthesis